MTGFVALHRSAFDHPILRDGDRFRAWFWLVSHAAWKRTAHDVRGHTIPIERGQLCTSRDRLAREWGWSPSRVERFLARLETEHMIERQTGQGKTVITICKYGIYQAKSAAPGQAAGQPIGPKSDSRRTTKEQGNKGTIPSDASHPAGRVRARTTPASETGAGKVRLAAGAAQAGDHAAGEAIEPTADALPAVLPATGHRLPDDWAAPSIDDLPPMARNMARQWPTGAFETSCEAFRLHWQNETGPNAVKRDWAAALARWIMGDHPRFMRDAKAGISFDAAAPAKRSQPRATKLVAAKRFEDERSNMIRDELAKTIGQQAVDQWLAPAALIHDGASLRLVCASAFARDWVRDHFADQIAAAVRAAGIDRRSDHVSFEIEPTAPRQHGISPAAGQPVPAEA